MTLTLLLSTKPGKTRLLWQIVLRQGGVVGNGMVMGESENPNTSSAQKAL